MTNIKAGKKQNMTSSSSSVSSKKMDESRAFSGDPVDPPVITGQKAQQSKALNSKNPTILPNSDIDGLLECPVCSNSMFPPIQQVLQAFSIPELSFNCSDLTLCLKRQLICLSFTYTWKVRHIGALRVTMPFAGVYITYGFFKKLLRLIHHFFTWVFLLSL